MAERPPPPPSRDNDALCAICLGSSDLAEFWLLPECGHTFHEACIKQLHERKCPKCRGGLATRYGLRIHVTRPDADPATTAATTRTSADEVIRAEEARRETMEALRRVQLEPRVESLGDVTEGAVGGEELPMREAGDQMEWRHRVVRAQERLTAAQRGFAAVMKADVTAMNTCKQAVELYAKVCLGVAETAELDGR